MSKTLQDLFNTPKQFVEQCVSNLKKLGYDGNYDYNRYIIEETSELINNYKNGNLENNRGLLIDDIVDSLWVITAKVERIPTQVYNKKYPMHIQMEMFEYCQTKYIETSQPHWLYEMVSILDSLCIINNINIFMAFSALCDENMSKLSFGEVSLDKLSEIYRTGKLNKKDPDGNPYPWFKPAKFSEF